MVTATAIVSNSGYLSALAKKEGGGDSSSSGGSSSSSGSSDSGSSSGSDSGSSDNSKGSDSNTNTKEAKPSEVKNPTDTSTGMGINEENGKPILPANPNPNPNPTDTPKPEQTINAPINFNCHFHPNDCKPDVPGQCPSGFASNDKGNCHPTGPCPSGFGRHDNDESGKCFKGKDFCLFHDCGHSKTIVKIVHQTKVIHKKQVSGIATVFVPGIGLVEPFNCKLNEDKGKIGCEFLIVKVIN